jgi:hypothetical protein
VKTVEHFETPEAFIFLYEKELFLTLLDGKLFLWNSNGERISEYFINFNTSSYGGEELCSKVSGGATGTDQT